MSKSEVYGKGVNLNENWAVYVDNNGNHTPLRRRDPTEKNPSEWSSTNRYFNSMRKAILWIAKDERNTTAQGDKTFDQYIKELEEIESRWEDLAARLENGLYP